MNIVQNLSYAKKINFFLRSFVVFNINFRKALAEFREMC